MNMRKIVYLAGLIATNFPASLEWRLVAESALDEHATVLSPMRGKGELFLQSKDGGVTDPNLTSGDILLRDYNDIQQADVVLVNMESFGSDRPMIGTIAEIAWAWERRVPIIAIATENNVLMRTHPFIQAMVTRYFPDLDSALDHVLSYYIGKPPAKRYVN